MSHEYIPTLGEYAEVIHWLVGHPNEEIPKQMRRVFDDAIDRAELRTFARSMAGYHLPEYEDALAADWQMRLYDAVTAPPCAPITRAEHRPERMGGAHFDLIAVDEANDTWATHPN